jgi:zeta-carotene desaturase
VSTTLNNSAKTVAVIGGGVAGMSAACALAEAGFSVQLVERRGYLGGRASSYLHPGVDEVIDNCQHVLFGCCTNLIGFYTRIGVQEKIHWTRHMTMIEPSGRRSRLGPFEIGRWGLPARLTVRARRSATGCGGTSRQKARWIASGGWSSPAR